VNENRDIVDEINLNHQFVVQLDRKNDKDFKCYSVGSDQFRAYIRQRTGYSEPDYTSSSDIVTICLYICGVNLSIGYRNEHSDHEHLIVAEWANTLSICRQWLSESKLPRFSLETNDPNNYIMEQDVRSGTSRVLQLQLRTTSLSATPADLLPKRGTSSVKMEP
jgi:hypothetical protein